MRYPALVIANEFIQKGINSGRPIDPMKLQKLVYLAHGWHLVFKGTPLIKEQIQAWPYGPVVPLLYSTFKSYRSNNIGAPAPVPLGFPIVDSETKSLLDQVWNKYGTRGAIDLSMMTHESGSAWDIARKSMCQGSFGPEISESLIKEEFQRRLRNSA